MLSRTVYHLMDPICLGMKTWLFARALLLCYAASYIWMYQKISIFLQPGMQHFFSECDVQCSLSTMGLFSFFVQAVVGHINFVHYLKKSLLPRQSRCIRVISKYGRPVCFIKHLTSFLEVSIFVSPDFSRRSRSGLVGSFHLRRFRPL